MAAIALDTNRRDGCGAQTAGISNSGLPFPLALVPIAGADGATTTASSSFFFSARVDASAAVVVKTSDSW